MIFNNNKIKESLVLAMSMVLSLNSMAETPNFQPGNKPFNNPYAPAEEAGEPMYEEDAVADEEFSDGGDAGDADGFSQPSSGGRPGTVRATNKAKFEVGGKGTGVVASEKSIIQPAAMVDDLGEKGSSEIITDFNFPDADVLDIAKALGKLTGKNFILDKDVKGRISIVSNTPVTVRDAWRAFLTSLETNDYSIVPAGKFLRILRNRSAREKPLPIFINRSAPNTDTLVTRIFKLKYLTASELVRATQALIPPTARIAAYDQTNTVILTDTGSNAKKLEYLIRILDIEGYDAGIEVLHVKYANASEISKLIDSLLPGTQAGFGPNQRFQGGAGGNQRFTARKTKEGGIINTIIADERTNNLIIHANTKGVQQIRELIAKLDRNLPAAASSGKVHVQFLQFADAETIANTINGIVTSAANPSTPRPTTGAGGTGVNPVQSSPMFEGNVKVSPDKNTNSLVITANSNDYTVLKRVIERLDIPRDQVYSEVIVMEVGISKKFDFSANILSPVAGSVVGSMPSPGDLATFITNPIGQTGAIIGFKGGKEKDVTIGGQKYQVGSIQGLIKLLQSNTNSNILATPTIMSLDNTDGEFESSETVPVQKVTALQGVSQASVDFQKVSVLLKIKPSINKSAEEGATEFIKLKIDAKLEDFSGRQLPSAVQSLAFGTVARRANTEVTVADGDTIVLGGLIRDSVKQSETKVPLLGDIPVLGWLFKSRSNEVDKTNTLIFITPKIVRQPGHMRAILDKKLKQRDEYIERVSGGEDLHRVYRDELIRGLKDVKTMRPVKRIHSGSIDEEEPISTSGGHAPKRTDVSSSAPIGNPNGNGNPNEANPAFPAPYSPYPPGAGGGDPNMNAPPPIPEEYSAPVPAIPQ